MFIAVLNVAALTIMLINVNAKTNVNCAELDHKTENCGNHVIKCYNCLEAKQKLKIDIDANHFIYDINCPVYMEKVENQKKKIKYLPSDSPFFLA